MSEANGRLPNVVFLGVPMYGYAMQPGTARAAYQQASAERNVVVADWSGSLLGQTFNGLWCTALNQRGRFDIRYFAMLHSDIEPEAYWIDKLIAELVTHDADVVSAVIPIKDDRGLTSTAVENPADPWHVERRLTMREVEQLPTTFGIADLGYADGRALLVNTGCWVCRFDSPWVEEVCFSIRDRIERSPNGTFRAAVQPEDWRFSRWLNERGLKAMATRAVKAHHVGIYRFPNHDRVWGWETDQDCEAIRNERNAELAAA